MLPLCHSPLTRCIDVARFRNPRCMHSRQRTGSATGGRWRSCCGCWRLRYATRCRSCRTNRWGFRRAADGLVCSVAPGRAHACARVGRRTSYWHGRRAPSSLLHLQVRVVFAGDRSNLPEALLAVMARCGVQSAGAACWVALHPAVPLKGALKPLLVCRYLHTPQQHACNPHQ